MNKPGTPESGNILFYILIAVALLAALMFAVSQSGRGNIQHVTEEKARLLAGGVIDYANVVSNAFGQLRLRGCALDKMNFANSTIGGYTNAGAPADQTCDIFALPGGGVTFQRPADEAVTATGIHVFTAETALQDIGTTCVTDSCADLIMFTGPLSETVCIQVNDRLGVGTAGDPPPASAANVAASGKFTGTVTYARTFGDTAPELPIKGRSAACIQDSANTLYYFYKVLATR